MAIIYEFPPDGLDAYIAHLPGVRRALQRTAQAGGARAEAILDAHRHAGHSQITVTQGDKLDWFVNLDDTRGQRAAAAIEFGTVRSSGIYALRAAF